MGVQTRVVLYAEDERTARDAAASAFDRIAALEQVMSDYRPDSELSLLGGHEGGDRLPVSAELFEILAMGGQVSEASEGAFDVTIGPVVKVWREARRTKTLPAQEAIDAAWSGVGYTNLRLDRFWQTAKFTASGMELDLGGIGKGFAAQRASDVLRAAGHTRHLVALAGDIVVGDPPPGAEAWRIDVQTGLDTPDTKRRRTLLLANAAVSTSGDAAQFFEIDGVRYAHIIDARSARVLDHAPTMADQAFTSRRGATVIAARGEYADAIGTALAIVGPEWLEKQGGVERIEAMLARFDARAAIVEWRAAPSDGVADPPLRARTIDPAGSIRWAE